MRIEINAKLNGENITINKANDLFTIKEEKIKNGKRIIGKINKADNFELLNAKITLEQKYSKKDKIISNSYQSWTKVREYGIDEKEEDYSPVLKLLDKNYKFTINGDRFFYNYKHQQGVFHSYNYTYLRDGNNYIFYGALNDSECFTIFESDCRNSEMNIIADVPNLLVDRDRVIFDFIVIEGNQDEVYDQFFKLMDIKPLKKNKVKGFTSWYNYYQDIDEEIILRNIDNFRKLKKEGFDVDLFQIDDGYETFVGDWLEVDKKKFTNGLKPLADEINKDFISGLWINPFGAQTTSKLYKEHRDWILRDRDGKEVYAGINWGGFWALDFYNEEVRNYVKKVFDVVFNEWGFQMVKLDFLYAACLSTPKNKTRGEVMSETMKFIRECCKDHIILGCGVPLSSAYGLVDYCRIGCDVSLDWEGGFIGKYMHKEAPSSLNAINDTVLRYPITNRAFGNDPDVFLLREDNIKMSHDEKILLSTVNAIFGNVLFTSDDFSKYSTNDLFDELKEIWKLNDCKVLSYDIIDRSVFKANIELDGKKQTVYINGSKKEVCIDGIKIGKKSVVKK